MRSKGSGQEEETVVQGWVGQNLKPIFQPRLLGMWSQLEDRIGNCENHKEMVLGGVMWRKKISSERLEDLHQEACSGHRVCDYSPFMLELVHIIKSVSGLDRL